MGTSNGSTANGRRAEYCIAIADDEPSARESFTRVLAQMGHQVHAVADGQQLVQLCQVSPPDLVLIDVRAQKLDAIEAARQVNQLKPTPIVLVTGEPVADVGEQVCSLPVMAYLSKPVAPEVMKLTVVLAVTRFRETQLAQQALVDRKLIERAKEIVANRLRVTAAEAFRRLRKSSSDQNRKLSLLAQRVIDADRIFSDLEANEARSQHGVCVAIKEKADAQLQRRE